MARYSMILQNRKILDCGTLANDEKKYQWIPFIMLAFGSLNQLLWVLERWMRKRGSNHLKS